MLWSATRVRIKKYRRTIRSCLGFYECREEGVLESVLSALISLPSCLALSHPGGKRHDYFNKKERMTTQHRDPRPAQSYLYDCMLSIAYTLNTTTTVARARADLPSQAKLRRCARTATRAFPSRPLLIVRVRISVPNRGDGCR